VPIRVTVFTQISDEAADPEVITTTSLEKLLGRREFEEADLHLFEFGHFFELFDATLAVPETALIAAVYHNITPVELSHDLEFQRRIRRSLAQKHNLFLADRILCVSEFNRDDLLGFGIPADRLTVLATPPAVVPLQHEAAAGETVELLFVGRIIPAKGVLDLVQALAEVVQGGVTEVRLTVAGNVALSSADCLHEIRELVKTGGLEDHVRIVHPDDEELGRLYALSDALVMPSYHEGFCVPVVEALSAQCHVIASDAGNLPRTVGGLGTLVPAGDVTALARAIADFAGRVLTARRSGEQMAVPTANGPIPEDVWRRRTADHVAQYSRQAFERGFAEFLAWAAQRSGREAVAEAIRRWPV
jgi:glycosyltransferase involved in cell wall biosynthesis